MSLCLHFPTLSCHCKSNFYWAVRTLPTNPLAHQRAHHNLLVLLKLLFKGDWHLKNTRFWVLYVTKEGIYLHNMLLCRNSLNILNWCLLVTSKLEKLVQNSLYRIFSSAFLKNISPWQFSDYCLLCNLIPIIFFAGFLWQDFESLLLNCFGISSSPDAASYHLCRFISISYFSRLWQSNLSS